MDTVFFLFRSLTHWGFLYMETGMIIAWYYITQCCFSECFVLGRPTIRHFIRFNVFVIISRFCFIMTKNKTPKTVCDVISNTEHSAGLVIVIFLFVERTDIVK